MKHPFATRDGQRVAVIRPDDPDLALRLTQEHIRTEKERTPDENEEAFNAILTKQSYTHVGFLARAGRPNPKLLNKHGWAIGDVRPGDAFCPESDITRAREKLDELEAKWTSEGVGTEGNPCTFEHATHFRLEKFCKCTSCGGVSECTPKNDFFQTAPNELRCPSCYATFLNERAGRGEAIGPDAGKIVGQDIGKCPCGASIGSSLKGEEPHVTHALPVCTEFAGMAPAEYIAWVRRQRMD